MIGHDNNVALAMPTLDMLKITNFGDEYYYNTVENGFFWSFPEEELNSFKFRSPELVEDPTSILCLGCSATMGTGVAYDETWPQQLGKELGCTAYNLGTQGGSGDSVYRFMRVWTPILKPKAIFVLFPRNPRRDFYDEKSNHWVPFGPYRPRDKYAEYSKKHFEILTSIHNTTMNSNMIYDAMVGFTHRNNVPIYFMDTQPIGEFTIDVALDLLHPGPKTYKKYAELFKGMYLNDKIQNN